MEAPPAWMSRAVNLNHGRWATTGDRRDLIVMQERAGPELEENGHEGPDVPEPHPLVGPAGGHVEVVDVERHGGREAVEAQLDDRSHAADGQPLSAQLGVDPDA